MASLNWDLKPGDKIKRKFLHQQYGGGTQGGIGSSRLTPNVLIFSDPLVGKKHGYIDGWMDDGCYHYTGQGQHGDQEMKSGNAAILNHKQDGRNLRLFLGVSDEIEYIGEFQIHPQLPFYKTDAPETGNGPVRSVIVFRLQRIDVQIKPHEVNAVLPASDQVKLVPVEEQYTERSFIEPGREPYEAERRESKLVQSFCLHLRSKGYTVHRLQVLPKGEVKPIFSDLYVPEIPLLVEAKGTVARDSIRMALGQLMDYRRFVPGGRCAILLPSQPREDIIELAKSAGVELYWPEDANFKMRV